MDELSPLARHDHDLDAHTGGKSDFRAHIAGIAAMGLTVFGCTALTYFSHFTFGFLKVVFGFLYFLHGFLPHYYHICHFLCASS